MDFLDVQDRLEYARCAVAVLRALKVKSQRMTYQEFGRAIGLIADRDPWHIRYREQLRAIFQITAAVERQGLGGFRPGFEPLNFNCVVNESGVPGIGIDNTSQIVVERPSH